MTAKEHYTQLPNSSLTTEISRIIVNREDIFKYLDTGSVQGFAGELVSVCVKGDITDLRKSLGVEGTNSPNWGNVREFQEGMIEAVDRLSELLDSGNNQAIFDDKQRFRVRISEGQSPSTYFNQGYLLVVGYLDVFYDLVKLRNIGNGEVRNKDITLFLGQMKGVAMGQGQ